MKTLNARAIVLLLSVFLMLPLGALAQTAVPMLINYQGELRSPTTGDPVPDGSYDMVFRIYGVLSGGTALWTGTHSTANGNPVQVTGGTFSVILGSGTGNVLDASVFNGADRWLETRVGTETLSPRQRMVSVAYAIASENSRLVGGKQASEFANSTHAHSGGDITLGTVAEARIDPAITRDTEKDSAIAAHKAIADAHHARYTNAEAVAAMGAKANTNPLNHDKTTTFSELTGTATDAQIPASIARDSEIMPAVLAGDGTGSGLDADKLDGVEGATLEESAEIDSDIAAHKAIADAHHARYTNAEAVAAMGVKANTNPLNHDKTTTFSELTGTAADAQIPASIARDSEIMPAVLANDGTGSGLDADKLDGLEAATLEESAEIDSDVAAHTAIASAHHTRYTDSEAVAAMGAKADTNPLNHDKTTSLPWGSITAKPAGFADGVDNDSGGDITAVTPGAGLSGGGEFGAVALSAAFGGSGSANTIARSDHDHGATYWMLTGNSGTSGANFLGTTDDQPLELRVAGTRVLRLEPQAISPNVIGGYSGNTLTPTTFGATISGGGRSTWENLVTDNYGTVGGGASNRAGDNAGTTENARFATVGGGLENSANGDSATVGGGAGNIASIGWATVGGGLGNTASGECATVAGGSYNEASANYATIAGGGPSLPGSPWMANRVSDEYGTVGGGGNNQAGDDAGTTTDASYATVGGGESNTASGEDATVGGGANNTASGDSATVAGGYSNMASAENATIGGGDTNAATGYSATVAGGEGNTASGLWATVPGGDSNHAIGYWSFAAGRRAIADGAGSFVWGDANPYDLHAWGDNQFVVRSTGGYWLFSAVDGSGNPTSGATLAAGSGTWGSYSDRDGKTNCEPADSREVLEKVAALPISTWSYKTQDPSIRHLGPMAQDFYAAFGLGEDDKHISAVDADGVALAAIQGLHEMLREKDEKISTLEARIAALEGLVEKLVESQAGGEE